LKKLTSQRINDSLNKWTNELKIILKEEVQIAINMCRIAQYLWP
jgi:hypothetical protein